MRIAIYTLVTPTDKVGVGEYLSNLIEGLQLIDDVNQYFIFKARGARKLFPIKSRNFHEILINIPERERNLFRLAKIFHYHTIFLLHCKKLKIDLIHIPNTQMLLFSNLITVSTIHDLREYYMRHTNIMRTLYRKAANYMQATISKLIITVSKSTRNDINQILKVPNEKIRVIYSTASNRFSTSKFDFQKISILKDIYEIDTPYILTVSSHMMHKNLVRIVKALTIVKRELGELPWKMVIAGKRSDSSNEIVDAMRSYNMANDIILTGYIPDEHLACFYQHARVFIFVSLWEGFGIPILEAMKSGCPVVCSNIEVLQEIYNGAAVFVDPYSEYAISNALIKIENDTQLRNNLIEKGNQKAKVFSCQIMAENTLSVFNEAVRRTG